MKAFSSENKETLCKVFFGSNKIETKPLETMCTAEEKEKKKKK